MNASSVNHAPNIIDASACSNSSSLQSCSAQLNASCSQLFGVTCQEPCPEGEVRLTGGTDAMEGLVEVCRGGVFGALCDETWCDANARVVCGQLGYSRNGEFSSIHVHTYFSNLHWLFCLPEQNYTV